MGGGALTPSSRSSRQWCHAIVLTAHSSENPSSYRWDAKMSHWTESPFVRQPVIQKNKRPLLRRRIAPKILTPPAVVSSGTAGPVRGAESVGGLP